MIGIHSSNEVKINVTKEMALSLFDLRPEDKKRLKIARFNDPDIAPHIYDKFLYAYGKFPNNDEVPQYFVRMLFAQFREHMDPNYTDTGSKFYGVGKGLTYERPDAMRDVGFRPPAPRLVPRPHRVVTLPEELALISSAASKMRDKIQEHIAAALGGVEVGLGTSQPSSSVGEHSFVSVPDEVLREME